MIALPPAAAATAPPQRGDGAGSGAFAGSGGALPSTVPDQGLRSIDVREAAAARSTEPAGSPAARAELRGSLGPEGVFETDPATGTPRVVARLDGFLTGPSSASPEQVALGYARANAAALGLDRADLDGLRLTRDYTDTSQITHLIWAQSVDGVEAFENGLYANVTGDGRLINLIGSPVAGLAAIRSVAPRLSARDALGAALDDAGSERRVPAVRSSSGPDRATDFAGGDDARLVLFTADSGDTRLAWRVTAKASSTEIYEYVLDASSGEVLLRQNTVDFASGAVWQYSPNINQVCAECSPASGTQSLTAFPASWNTQATQLQGTNGHVYTDVDDNNVPDTPFGNCPECGEIGPSLRRPGTTRSSRTRTRVT